MSKGEQTKARVLDRAVALASLGGLQYLSVGTLSTELKMSKSGLFAHFNSKEQLQLDILARAVERFVETVVAPSLKKPRGEARVRALFEHWLEWDGTLLPGGCVFAAAGAEINELPASVQAALVESQRDWLLTIETVAKAGVAAGALRADLDTEGFAFDFIAITRGHHYLAHVLREERATALSQDAMTRLLERSRPTR